MLTKTINNHSMPICLLNEYWFYFLTVFHVKKPHIYLCIDTYVLIQNPEIEWKFVKWIFYNTDLCIIEYNFIYALQMPPLSFPPRTILLLRQIVIRYLYSVDIVASLISNFEWYYNVIYLNGANNKKNFILCFNCELNLLNFCAFELSEFADLYLRLCTCTMLQWC